MQDAPQPDAPPKKAMRDSFFPFNRMNVGDSFDCDPEDVNSMRRAAYNHGKRHGTKFLIRSAPGGYAFCWRIE